MSCLGVDLKTAFFAAVLAVVWLFLGAMVLGFIEGAWRAYKEYDDE